MERIYEKWMEKAKRFLQVAKRDLDDGYYDFAALNSQQAAEFALKALLIKKTGFKPYTHSISELLDALSEVLDVPDTLRECEGLEEHYVQARYPDARLRDYRREEAEKAVDCAEVIVSYAEGILEEDSREG